MKKACSLVYLHQAIGTRSVGGYAAFTTKPFYSVIQLSITVRNQVSQFGAVAELQLACFMKQLAASHSMRGDLYRLKDFFFAQSMHIKLDSPQAARHIL